MFKMSKQDLLRAHVLMGNKMDKSIDASQSILIDEDKVAFKEEGWLSRHIYSGQYFKNERNKIIAYIVIASLLLFILAVLSNRLLFPAVILPTVYVFINISRRAYKRVENFERDYPVFLLSLASSVRTGLDSSLCADFIRKIV